MASQKATWCGSNVVELYPHRLRLRVEQHRIEALVSTLPGLLVPTPRLCHVGSIEAIDPDHAGFKPLCHFVRGTQILCPDAGRQAVDGIVGNLNSLVDIVDGYYDRYRPENLFPRDLHFIVRAREESRLNVATVFQALGHNSAQRKRSAFLLARFNVIEHPLLLGSRNQRAHLDVGIERIAWAITSLCALNKKAHEFVMNTLIYKEARTRVTDLALITVDAVNCNVDCL